ncbi:MAG: hypothetical protein PHI11_10995 [Gallionella sp.]|nr:hypothetical protein [Gallionella sp.]
MELTSARGDDLLSVAKATSNFDDKLNFLILANKTNPASTDILIELGKVQRSLSRYSDAIYSLCKARNLSPSNHLVLRELGVTYSKSGQIL